MANTRYTPPQAPIDNTKLEAVQNEVFTLIDALLTPAASTTSSKHDESSIFRYFCCFKKSSPLNSKLLDDHKNGQCEGDSCRHTSFIYKNTDAALASIIEDELKGNAKTSAFLGGSFGNMTKRAYRGSIISSMTGDDRATLLQEFNHFIAQLKSGNIVGSSAALLELFRGYGSFLSIKQNSHHSPLNYILVYWFLHENPATKDQCLCFIEKNFVQDAANGLGNSRVDKSIVCLRPDPKGSVPHIFFVPLPQKSSTRSVQVNDYVKAGIPIDENHNKAVVNGLKLAKGLECYRSLTTELVNNGYYVVALDLLSAPYLVFHQKDSPIYQIRFMDGVDPSLSRIDPVYIMARIDGARDGASCHINNQYGTVSTALENRAEARNQRLAKAIEATEGLTTATSSIEMR